MPGAAPLATMLGAEVTLCLCQRVDLLFAGAGGSQIRLQETTGDDK
jgi:hypothetical protein